MSPFTGDSKTNLLSSTERTSWLLRAEGLGMMEKGNRKSSEVTMFCNRTAGLTYICKTSKNTFSQYFEKPKCS